MLGYWHVMRDAGDLAGGRRSNSAGLLPHPWKPGSPRLASPWHESCFWKDQLRSNDKRREGGMVERTSQGDRSLQSYSFNPSWPLARILEEGVFFYNQEIEAYHDDEHVSVTDHGRMILLGSNSY